MRRVPSSHARHSLPFASAPKVPALQLAASTAPAKQKVPCGQSLHCSLLPSPVWLLKKPAGQGKVVEAPSAQYEPAAHHRHAVCPGSS